MSPALIYTPLESAVTALLQSYKWTQPLPADYPCGNSSGVSDLRMTHLIVYVILASTVTTTKFSPCIAPSKG